MSVLPVYTHSIERLGSKLSQECQPYSNIFADISSILTRITSVISTMVQNTFHCISCINVTGGVWSLVVATQASVSTCTSLLRGKDKGAARYKVTPQLCKFHILPMWMTGRVWLNRFHLTVSTNSTQAQSSTEVYWRVFKICWHGADNDWASAQGARYLINKTGTKA